MKIQRNKTNDIMPTKTSGNHTEPLKTDAVRNAAAEEQAQLQQNPDSLPASSYPNQRSVSSAAKNADDPVLPPVKPAPEKLHGER